MRIVRDEAGNPWTENAVPNAEDLDLKRPDFTDLDLNERYCDVCGKKLNAITKLCFLVSEGN